MSTHLYTVTLTDLGTYRVTVAAGDTDEAARIAKAVLLDEAFQGVAGLAIVKREVEAQAQLDELATAKAKPYQVDSTYRLDFAVEVVGNDRADAERNAKRLVEISGGPFEFFVGDCDYGPWVVQEVQP